MNPIPQRSKTDTKAPVQFQVEKWDVKNAVNGVIPNEKKRSFGWYVVDIHKLRPKQHFKGPEPCGY